MTLNRDGKDKAVEVAEKVPVKILDFDSSLSCGDENSGNLIVQGDNLKVLKSLLPFYHGSVKCIYIDIFVQRLIQFNYSRRAAYGDSFLA